MKMTGCRVLVVWLAVGLAACSNGPGVVGAGARCTQLCDDACAALAACPAGAPPGCSDTCLAGIDHTSCSNARPADQQTCAQLTKLYSCADYCNTLCGAAPRCGSFDPAICRSGCAHNQPVVCNSASVAARTCDQLKVELQLYQDAGTALARGDAFGASASPKQFGLCASAFDCPSMVGCSTATNTCGPCTTNADCTTSIVTSVCTSAGQCQIVDCLSDADCGPILPVCGAANTCRECASDAQCTGSFIGPRCDVTTNSCVACLSNADCNTPQAPVCSSSFHFCLPS